MSVRRLKKSWQYDFTIPGMGRHRKGGFRTKREAEIAERTLREELLEGGEPIRLEEAFSAYLAGTRMKDRSRDRVEVLWKEIAPELGHLHVEEIDTLMLDAFKRKLRGKKRPSGSRVKEIGPATMNRYLEIVRATLRFMWKRGKLRAVPYVPLESVPRSVPKWYSAEERDRFLAGIYRLEPEWYCFFYLTMRTGLRLGEVFALSKEKLRRQPAMLVVDRAVQRGDKRRPAVLVTRKNDEAYVLHVTDDVIEVIDWHVEQGYAGEPFLFSKDGTFPVYLDSHRKPMWRTQDAVGLPRLGHHALGRHSVASQAVTAGASIKAMQAQLGHKSEQSTHKYAHLGSTAQRQVMEQLRPAAPAHGNVRSTGTKTGGHSFE